MLKIKVKTPKRKIFIPVPYGVLKIAIIFLSSESIRKRLNNIQREEEKDKQEGNLVEQDRKYETEVEENKKESSSATAFFTPETKKILKLVLKELKRYRGMELVSVQSKDTFISIQL
ncbi:hypothetical protein [Fervidibacillus albus]|uniref:Uncharacterized protein n=1 Tax=Fervidibacillus albus TaxID=2980026 RepID=A0A9E8LSM1_9BACI|nr:hypothetical protein [Fervidibacillus albus]WAA08847.1 hypothetical protein OE104_09520 [Fervidibacillus albus]